MLFRIFLTVIKQNNFDMTLPIRIRSKSRAGPCLIRTVNVIEILSEKNILTPNIRAFMEG